MRDEVEEFLKRVAQMRAQAEAQAKGRQQRPPAQPPAPSPPQPARLVPARQETRPRRPVEPVEAEVVDAELADKDDGVARHVSQYLTGDQQIAEHTRRLGEEVDAADDKMAAHLHKVFDHQLGRLKTTASETAAAPPERPAPEVNTGELIARLRSPQSVRDAIVLAEILHRPEW
jgi:hypothetical protein